MKVLYLVRHGKSSWSHPESPDDQRPLVHKGEISIKNLAEEILSKGKKIDLIISSHAIRALESAKIIAAILKYPDKEIKIDKTIYTSDADSLFDPLFELPESTDSVMLVGHNPAMTYFANKLLNENIEHMPTSAMICIGFEINDWHDIIKTKGKELFRIFSKSND